MNRVNNISTICKYAIIAVACLVLAFTTSVVVFEFTNEFLRVHWQYQLFDNYESNMFFIYYLTTVFFLTEVITMLVLKYKKKRANNYGDDI